MSVHHVNKWMCVCLCVCRYLLQAQSMPHTISGVMPFMGLRMMNVLEGAWLYQDQLENELIREADNGRLFRMLAKMGAVNERPEYVFYCLI